MRIDFMTLFPDMIRSAFSESIIARGVEAGYLDIRYHQIRDYTTNKQGKVDDYPYGGGPGLIMSYQPIADTYKHIIAEINAERTGALPAIKPYCIYMSPQGRVLDQKTAKRLSKMPNLVILCGHYEGIDERVIEDFVDEEISIGDYVLTGGELPACVMTDCIARLVPGVLSTEEATESESHTDGLLEYPQYTRPAEINGKGVPGVLLSGNHGEMERWRLEQSLQRTRKKRPDLVTHVYLDNSATTRQSCAVTEEMQRVSGYRYGNPSSLHRLGLAAEKELRAARQSIAKTLNAAEKEILFTSGGSESNNWALRGVLDANPRLTGKILSSAGEHPSVAETASYLERHGRRVLRIPLKKDGTPDMEALQALMAEGETSLVSILHVNSETGAISPLTEIAALIKSIDPNVIFHVDAVQGYGKFPLHPAKQQIDLLSMSAHKIHGPRGIGALYCRSGLKLEPLIFGGGQEGGLRAGTENLPGICGFAKAASETAVHMNENFAHVSELNSLLRAYISENFQKAVIISDSAVCSPYVFCVSFPGIGAEVLLHSLEAMDVYVSVGSACSSHKKNRSHVLSAMGYPVNIIDGAIRISFSPQNTKGDVERACDALHTCLKTLYKRKRH